MLFLAAMMAFVFSGCAEETRYVASPSQQLERDPALVDDWSRDTFPPDPYYFIPGVANTITLYQNGSGTDWWRSPFVGPDYTLMFEETTRSLRWHTSDGILYLTYNDTGMSYDLPYWMSGFLLVIQYTNSTVDYSRL